MNQNNSSINVYSQKIEKLIITQRKRYEIHQQVMMKSGQYEDRLKEGYSPLYRKQEQYEGSFNFFTNTLLFFNQPATIWLYLHCHIYFTLFYSLFLVFETGTRPKQIIRAQYIISCLFSLLTSLSSQLPPSSSPPKFLPSQQFISHFSILQSSIKIYRKMPSIISILFFVTFFIIASTQFTYSRSKNFLLGGTISTLHSIHFSQNIVAFKQIQANYRVVTVEFSEAFTQIKAYNNSLLASDVLRSAQSNQLASSTQFITFTGNSAIKRIDNFSQILAFYNCTSNLTIVESLFGFTLDRFVVLAKNYSSNVYTLLYIENTTILNETRLFLNISVSYLRYEKSGSYCSFLFENEILVFQFLNANNIELIKSIKLPYASANHSISFNSSIFAYSIGSKAYLTSVKELLNQFDAVDVGQEIYDLNVAYPYCLISTAERIYQYDLEIQKIVSIFNKSFGVGVDYRFEVLQNKIMVFYKRHPLSSTVLYIYTFGNRTFCNGSCANCQRTYRLDSNTSSCIKDTILPIQQYPNFISNATNSSNNSFFNSLNNSNNSFPIQTSNITINQFNLSNISNSSEQSETIEPQKIQSEQKEGQLLEQVLKILGKSFTFASFRLTPKFLLSLTFFVEELQVYKVHQFNYSESVAFFMEKATLINQIKLSDWIVNISSYLHNDSIAVEQNSLYVNFQNEGGKNLSQIYFLNSNQQFYKISLTTCFIIYLGSKILHLLVYLANKKISNRLLKNVNQYFDQKTHPIFLFIFVIESNLPDLAFNCFLQVKYVFRKSFHHSVNHLICFTLLFLLMIYTFALFPLGYSCRNKRSARHFITRSKNRVASYFSESFCLMGRIMLKNFIHAYFYDTYQTQIILIVTSDILCLLPILIFRKTFFSLSMVVTMLIYNVIFLSLNLTFLLRQQLRGILLPSITNNVHFTLLVLLMASSILISLIVLSKQTGDIKKKMILCLRQSLNFNNRISNQKIVRFSEYIHMERSQSRRKAQISQINRDKDIDSRATTVSKRQHRPARTSREISLPESIPNFSCMSLSGQKNLVLIENCLKKSESSSLKGTVKIKKTKTNKYEIQMKEKQVKYKTEKNLANLKQ